MKKLENIARPIIQGGMGVGVSNWKLAKASAMAGAIGIVSGTASASLMVNALQKGDPGGHYRRALGHFPFPHIAEDVLRTYFVEGGAEKRFKELPMWSFSPPTILQSVTICANFAFVWLAKEGHQNPIGINFLHEIKMPHMLSVLGAMLAGVDLIVMGAGIPKDIPALIDSILAGDEIVYMVPVIDFPVKFMPLMFDPKQFLGGPLPKMERPLFFPIVSSNVLADYLIKSCPNKIDGFVVETSVAGGHNAPPRGQLKLTETGEPIYSERDEVKPQKFVEIGLPFWLAGSFGSPEGLKKAQSEGAFGVQVGTVFAFCDESGIDSALKNKGRRMIHNDELFVYTSPVASPTGFPFKILSVPGTIFEKEIYNSRVRNCSMGYLREAVWLNDKVIFRCSAEPVKDYERKGGEVNDTIGRMCLCNALTGTVNARPGEMTVLTAGDDIASVRKMMKGENSTYTAEDVVKYLSGY